MNRRKQKRTLKLKEVVSDIRSGISDAELMGKYKLSLSGLSRLFDKLLQIRAITKVDFYIGLSKGDDTADIDRRRETARCYLTFPLPVYDTGRLEDEGTVIDISPGGLQVRGIPCELNETKELLICSDEYHDVHPLVFSATCRWVNKKKDDSECTAGFEFSDISSTGREMLCRIIEDLTLGEEASYQWLPSERQGRGSISGGRRMSPAAVPA